jgi:CDP-2,3-bis-(O-geranylgeranyl)-sn-glycerol synthase
MELSLTVALTLKLLVLLLAANGSPVIAKRLFGTRWTYPVDGGLIFVDGRPLLGKSKTVRGIVVGVVATSLVAPMLGFSWVTGALFGLASLSGDALSSFVKRRLNIQPSGMAFGLDQIPEALLPLWLFRATLGLDFWSVLILVVLFTLGELMLSRVMFWLGVRDHPY